MPSEEPLTPNEPKEPSQVGQQQQMLRIVQPKQWIVLACVLILLAALIIWSFLGRIPTEVNGRAVALSSRGVFSIETKSSGIITNIHVKEGDIIDKSTLVMTLHNPNLKGIISHIRSTEFKIRQLEEELKILKESLKSKEELFKKGLIAKTIVMDATSTVYDKQIAIHEAKSALSGLFTDLEKNSSCGKEEIEGREAKFFEENNEEIFKLESCLSQVYSPEPGKVLEVLVDTGKNVDVKEPLVWMEYPPTENEKMIFLSCVPLQSGGRIKPGMPVKIEPTIVNPQEYGSIFGTVTQVSPFAISEQGLMNILHNHQLVNYLVGGAQAVLQINVEPITDSKTPSGYAWTSKEGPPHKIPTGAIATVKILVEEQPPISYLIPLWKLKP